MEHVNGVNGVQPGWGEDESPMVICVHCIRATVPKKSTYKVQGIQHLTVPFQVTKNSDDYDYREMYQLLLQISCYSEGILSQDLIAMQQKRQGLIREYLHFLVDNTCLVKKVGDSHLGFVYCLVENKPCLLTFEAFLV